MESYDLTIRGGRVALPGALVACDVGVRDGRIVALAERLLAGARDIDATGRLVLPGGVDGHCHFDQPTGDGSRMADDFLSGTRSALFGGTTTIIPFAAQIRGQSLRAAVDDYHARASGKAMIDHAFHLIVTDPTPEVLTRELPELIAEGYTSFKIYMTYDDLKLSDRQILEVLAVARDHGAMVMVHAENADCIAWLTDRLEAEGKTAPIFHAASRPKVIEREATHRAISFSELVDVPILVVHVSGADAMEEIRRAQSRGVSLYAETCPQYLFLSEDDLGGPGFEGARCICSPPPREAANQAAIWQGLATGVFSVVSSDHAPFRFDDAAGKKLKGEDASFRWVPNGIPGVETRLPLLFAGVVDGRLDLDRFVELTAAGPAKMYGLHPRKGVIAIGSDADLVVWDASRPVTIAQADLHSDCDYTPYEGITVPAWPEVVVQRGAVLAEKGRLVAEPGQGRFLPCDRPAPARPLGARRPAALFRAEEA